MMFRFILSTSVQPWSRPRFRNFMPYEVTSLVASVPKYSIVIMVVLHYKILNMVFLDVTSILLIWTKLLGEMVLKLRHFGVMMHQNWSWQNFA